MDLLYSFIDVDDFYKSNENKYENILHKDKNERKKCKSKKRKRKFSMHVS